MKIISHRGNLVGRILEKENSEEYIREAAKNGFDVEVDVWFIDGKYFLGHDFPQYETTLHFLKSLPLWCHAKNIEALHNLIADGVHCFWHNTDTFTLTSRNIIWGYSDIQHDYGIMVCLNAPDGLLSPIYGVCTDFPFAWKKWKENL